MSVFAETVKLGVKYGVDLIFIETMNDSYETKAALLAAKENSSLPVFVSNAYGEDGTLMTGASLTAKTPVKMRLPKLMLLKNKIVYSEKCFFSA